MWIELLAVIVGFALLVWGADRFVTGAAATARNLGVSPLIIGLTIVGFGTSAPEILVSIVAALQGNPGLAVGNALGSNITNVALILGLTAVIAPLQV
ncbi:MAG TPA: calcium/sodium antiporter, partial [Gammaproteobacteria bacterium]